MMKKNRKKITGIIMTIAMLLCLFPAMMVPASAAAGDTWTVQTSGVTANLNGVCYGGSTFVAVGANGTILTSSNGTSWINRTTTNSAATGGVELKAVCFGNGMFMAVGVGGKVITSSDGITWAAKVSETDALATDDLVAVAYGNNKFVALGKNSAGGYIYTSTDNGSNWGQTYSYSGYFLYGICYGNSQFVVVGDLDFINFDKEYGLVLVSADGQTWGDCKTDMAAQSFTSVCYGGTTYVAADIESRILKSSDPTDAAKWDNRGWQDTDYSSFNAVCYGGSTYVTVGFNGHIYISSDGSVWTSKTSNTSNALNSVCYGSTTFVTVGLGGTIVSSAGVVAPTAQTITFANPGAQNYGTTPTLTATASSGLAVSFTSDTPDVCTVTSGGALTFLKAGTATITAHQAGNASYLAASDVSQSFTVNATVPGAPTIGTATAGDAQATVNFTAPSSNGGSAITGYTVTSSPGGFTGTGDGSPITVTGLTNGTAYTFTVTATNTAGTGSASAASNSVTPKAAQTITFANPGAQNFGTTPTLTATASSGLAVNFTSDTTDVCTVTSGGTLTFLKAGTATITAHQTGNGSFLAASDVSRSFTVNAIVPGAPTIGTVTAGDTQATVTFTAPTSNGGSAITGYTVTSSPGGFMGTGDGSSPITVTGLTNGTAYTFTVTATNSAGAGSASAASNSVTPYGNSTITPTTAAFDKYTSATNYKDLTVTLILNGNTLNSIKNGADTLVLNTDYTTSGNTITIKKEYLKNLSTGTVNLTFDFSLGTDRTLSVTVSDSTPTSGGSTPAKTDSSTSTVVEVDGQKQDAGEKKTETADNGKTQTTVTVDDTKLNKILDTSGEKPIVTLPISEKTDVVVGELNGQTVKNMEQKEATLEIRTDTITYTLPASQINIDAVSSQIGSQVELKDIKVNVKIAEPPADTVKVVEDTANKNSYQIVVKPVEFEITCTSGSKTVQVSSFNGYVERTVAIPDGVDPSKITTGIVLNADGTFRHVPTQIVVINGKYFAKINSLTNSTYSVIWNPVTFTDVENHWAKSAVNDMGSRMVVTGVGNGSYEPGRSITRAEFATIVVRAMGLAKGTASSSFSDVSPDDWFNGYVDTATAYGLIAGYSKVAYGPNDTITREQAMAILARAMKITGLNVSLTDSEINALLAKYKDGADVSGYAREAVAACIKSGVIAGSSADLLSPKAYVSRAEVAVMVQRLLQKSGLI